MIHESLIYNYWKTETMGSIDHCIVKAPYLRLEEFKKGEFGDYVFKYDLRLTQPNTTFIPAEALHSLEHFLLVHLRKSMQNFIAVAPMGCQTGFYLIFYNDYNPTYLSSKIEQAFKEILIATEVPLSNIHCCGHASYHSLEGAQHIALNFLEKKDEWLTILKES